MLAAVCGDLDRGREKSLIASAFMNTLTDAALRICLLIRKDSGLGRVCLSGGSFQNMYMLKRLTEALEKEGFAVFTHSRVSANDEGLAFGQLAIAAKGKI
jgi:hydrogenase maturation protein HypF